jgi:hypothetical protein
MNPAQLASCLLMGISAALFYLAWDEQRWLDVEPEPEPPPEPRAFPLVLPARAGWGTCLDLAMTKVFERQGPPIVPDRIIDVY